MRVPSRLPVLACLTSLAATLGAIGATAAPALADSHHGSPVIGDLYVNDNTAPANTIGGFARHADGSLTPLAGSPFAAGGAGAGKSVGSQGSVQLADHGRYLLAVDNGSSQISVLAVAKDGSLSEVGSPVSSGGLQPVSIAVHRHLVYVANAGPGAENYTGFTLGRHGTLTPLAGSTVPLPTNPQPGDVLFNSTGTNLVGTEVGPQLIDSFAVGADGRLTAATGSPFAAQGPGPFGSEFRPTNPSQLFVSNAHGGPGNGTVSAFDVASDGTLTSIGDSPFADNQTAPCWVAITRDGRYLFAVNTAVPSVSSYQIAQDGSLTLIGSFPFRDGTGLAPEDAAVSPDGHTLWVTGSGGDVVSGFAIDHGALTELPGSPTALPAGATPFGIAVS